MGCAAAPWLLTFGVSLQDAGIAEKLLGIGVIDKAVDYIREDVTSFPELLVMILANVTATEKGCEQMLQLGCGDLEGFHM